MLPPELTRLLVLIWSALSITTIIYYGFNVNLGSTLLRIVDKYDWFVRNFAGMVKPYIEELAQYFDWVIILHPHWAHIFILLNLYFLSGAWADWKEKRAGRRSSAPFRLVLGLCVAFATSVMVGVLPLVKSDDLTNFLIAAIPFLFIAANDFLLRAWRGCFSREYEANRIGISTPTWWSYVKPAARGISYRTLFGLTAAFGALQIPLVRHLTSPGLALLGMFIVLLALDQIYLGAKENKSLRHEGESWSDAALRSRGTMIGLRMFSAFAWSGVFTAISVGGDILKELST